MASPTSCLDEPNHAQWLATGAGNIRPLYLQILLSCLKHNTYFYSKWFETRSISNSNSVIIRVRLDDRLWRWLLLRLSNSQLWTTVLFRTVRTNTSIVGQAWRARCWLCSYSIQQLDFLARDFYEVIVDEAQGRINFHLIEIDSE